MGIIFLLFIKCEDEVAQKREYPRLSTLSVSAISEQGVTFNANLYSLGSEAIINHGFVWGTYAEPELSDNKVYLGASPSQGIFQATINTTLKRNVDYFVRSFIQTGNHIVYGHSIKFRSLGSNAPLITGFEPKSACWGDTIIIYGKNFSWVARENIVRLNEIVCNTLTSSDTTIQVQVSSDICTINSILSVELAQNLSILTTDTFKLKTPVLIDYYPKQARWGDTIQFKFKLLKLLQVPISIVLGGVPCSTFQTIGDSICLITVPHQLSAVTSTFTITAGTIILASEQQFNLLPPYFTFTPSEGRNADIITLDGRFNNNPERNAFFFGGKVAQVLSTTETRVTVRVPVNLLTKKSFIEYRVTPFTYISQDTFKLKTASIVRIDAPLISTGNYEVNSVLAASLNGYAYLCSPASGKMYKFTPPSTWTEIFATHPFGQMTNAKLVTCSDTVYHIAGFDNSYMGRGGLSKFNEELNTWQKVSTFPSNYFNSIAFSLNNKIYYGNNVLYVCNPSASYTWSGAGVLPGNVINNISSYFSLENRGFVLTKNNQLWMFNPDTNSWSRKSDFPGTARTNACSYVIGTSGFVGTGYQVGTLSDIWEYDFVTDTWSCVGNLPVSRHAATSFSINNNGYIGFGGGPNYYNNPLYDLYEINPLY